MSEKEISNAVDDLISLTLEGKWEIAFEKYYAPDIEKTDLDGVAVRGWEQNVKNGRQFASRISNVRDFSCAGKVVQGSSSFIVWSLDFDVDGAPFRVTEVAIQKWANGKIVNERFFA